MASQSIWAHSAFRVTQQFAGITMLRICSGNSLSSIRSGSISMTNATDPISQREKREIMENDRLVREAGERRGRTYAGHALDNEPDVGGRFAKVSTTTVVGTSPINYPQQPPGSPWHSDPCPPEPPLGFSVDAMEPVGEKYEVEASTADGTSAVEEGGPASGHVITSVAGPTSKRFRRRA